MFGVSGLFGSPRCDDTIEETAARQLQAYQRRSKVDQLTDIEKLQLGMEIETMAAKIIANRPNGLPKEMI